MHHRLVHLTKAFLCCLCPSALLRGCGPANSSAVLSQALHVLVHPPKVTIMEVWTRHAPKSSSAGYAHIQGPACVMEGVEHVGPANILLLNSSANSQCSVSAKSATFML